MLQLDLFTDAPEPLVRLPPRILAYVEGRAEPSTPIAEFLAHRAVQRALDELREKWRFTDHEQSLADCVFE
jgi:hypothetical protein